MVSRYSTESLQHIFAGWHTILSEQPNFHKRGVLHESVGMLDLCKTMTHDTSPCSERIPTRCLLVRLNLMTDVQRQFSLNALEVLNETSVQQPSAIA